MARFEVCTHQCIRAFDVAADGTLSNNRIFATLASAADGVPDGMKVYVEGRVDRTGPEGCWVFDASGNHLESFASPKSRRIVPGVGLITGQCCLWPDIRLYAADEDPWYTDTQGRLVPCPLSCGAARWTHFFV